MTETSLVHSCKLDSLKGEKKHYFCEQNEHTHNMVISNATYLIVRTEFEEEPLKEFEVAEEYDIDLECEEVVEEAENINEQQEQQEENTVGDETDLKSQNSFLSIDSQYHGSSFDSFIDDSVVEANLTDV